MANRYRQWLARRRRRAEARRRADAETRGHRDAEMRALSLPERESRSEGSQPLSPLPSTRYSRLSTRHPGLRTQDSGPGTQDSALRTPHSALTPSFVHASEEEFARLLDFYRIEWVYEPRSFPLRWVGDQVVEMFTPDFYLPGLDMYVELTTMKQSLVTRKNRKLRRLRELYPDISIRLLYKRDYHSLLGKYGYRALTPTTLEMIDHVLLSAEELRARTREVAAEISRDYAGRELRLVGILKGVAFFMTDLMRELAVPVSTDYMFITKYNRDGQESEAVRILKDLDMPVEGRHVLLVEDIVDTGLTLRYILNYLRARRPASLRVCTLLDKRARRLVDEPLAYVAFEIPDEFVVGYGLDHRELYRNLPYVCVLKPEAYWE